MSTHFQEMFKQMYPRDPPAHERPIDWGEPTDWRPLKCAECGVKLARRRCWQHFDTPYCGPHYPGRVTDVQLSWIRHAPLMRLMKSWYRDEFVSDLVYKRSSPFA